MNSPVLDLTLTQTLESCSSSPEAPLRTLRELIAAQVPTHVMLAPIVPGLTDAELPALLNGLSPGCEQPGKGSSRRGKLENA